MPRKGNNDQKNLDEVFREFLRCMKPLVLKVHAKEERQIISSWIKKLCDPSIESVTERKNRNLYAQILLQMVQSGNLREPFTSRPQSGKLPTIPAYMSSYLDETASNKNKRSSVGPDWLQGEEFDDTLLWQTINHQSYPKYKHILSPHKHERFMLANSLLETVPAMSRIHEDPADDSFDMSDLKELTGYSDEKDVRNLNSTERPAKKMDDLDIISVEKGSVELERKGYAEIRNAFREKELELKLKLVDGKVKEETLKLQQQHDQMVKKILDRKNIEMSDLKQYFQSKISELEDALKDYDKKVKHANEEMKHMHERHLVEVDRLKDMIQKKASSTAVEYEKMMYDRLNDFETEMFNIQKMHRENIEEIIAEADGKMKSLKADFSVKKEEMLLKNTDLLKQVENLQRNNEISSMEKLKLQKQKEELNENLKRLSDAKVKNVKRIEDLEKEIKRLNNDHDMALNNLRKKSDETFEKMKKERTVASSKAFATISELESKLNEHENAIQDMELKRHRQLKEQDVIHKQAVMQLELSREKQVREIQAENEKKEMEYQNKIRLYELTLKEKDVANSKLDLKLQAHQKETASLIDNFKKHAEENSDKLYMELNSQLEHLQQSLEIAKGKIESQKTEYNKRLSEQSRAHEEQIVQCRETCNTEKLQLMQKHKDQREQLISSYQKEKEEELTKLQQTWQDIEGKYKTQLSQYMQNVSDLEAQVRDLREQVIKANSLRKDQLQEVGMLRDEEKLAAKRNEETMLSQYKSKLEQIRLQIQKEHGIQLSEYTEKMDSHLKSIEKEYISKASRDQMTISELQFQITEMKENHLKKVTTMEMQLEGTVQQKNNFKKEGEEKLKALKKEHATEMETQAIKYNQLEKKYLRMELQSNEKLSRCRLDYEEKIRGLLPATTKTELEDTIDCMRQQIQMLQSRADLLQEELNTSNTFASARNTNGGVIENNKIT